MAESAQDSRWTSQPELLARAKTHSFGQRFIGVVNLMRPGAIRLPSFSSPVREAALSC
jgi:hypothetical protein